jgi:hypothetical protein
MNPRAGWRLNPNVIVKKSLPSSCRWTEGLFNRVGKG